MLHSVPSSVCISITHAEKLRGYKKSEDGSDYSCEMHLKNENPQNKKI